MELLVTKGCLESIKKMAYRHIERFNAIVPCMDEDH